MSAKNIFMKSSCNHYLRCCIVLAAVLVSTVTSVAQSTYVPVPFTQRTGVNTPSTQVYHIRGDYTMIGNSQLYSTSNSGYNNNVPLYYNDVDDDANTVNSTSAYLGFSQELDANPNCSRVVYAGLYWTGKKEREDVTGTMSMTVGGTSATTTNNTSNWTNGHTYNGYVVTISKTSSKSGGNNPTFSFTTTYTLHPTGGGDDIVFTYSKNGIGLNSYNNISGATLTVKVGNGTATNVTHTLAGDRSSEQQGKRYYYVTATITGGYTITIDANTTLKINNLRTYYRYGGDNKNNSDAAGSTINDTYDYLNVTYSHTTPAIAGTTLYKNQVKFKHEDGTYQTITASTNDIYYPSQAGGEFSNIYVAYADVTDIVNEYGQGNYYVADLACLAGTSLYNDGLGYFGGWGLVVVYENSKMRWRDITMFDGICKVGESHTLQDIHIEGIKSVQVGQVNMKVGVMAAEGENPMCGDLFEMKNVAGNYVKLSHSGNADYNFFNGSINTGGNTRNPNNTVNLGFDCAFFELDNTGNQLIENNQEEVDLRFELNSALTSNCGNTYKDTYFPFFMAFGCDAYVPDAEALSVVWDLPAESYDTEEGVYVINPGDTVTFHIDVNPTFSKKIFFDYF